MIQYVEGFCSDDLIHCREAVLLYIAVSVIINLLDKRFITDFLITSIVV